MGVAVLGPLQVDGQMNGLGPRDRVVLAALVVRAGEPITTETLADALWGETLPASWTKVLQGCVVRLRKLLGPGAIQSTAHGYRLALTDEELDHRQFERLLERAREALAGGDPARGSYLAQEALQLWRGPALPDLDEWEPGRVETVRLDELRRDAEELLVEAEVAAGRAREVLERARALVTEAPFREPRWALLARALHASGRQPEALGALRRARAMLVGEFGLDPGRELVELETLLLRQDPSLVPVLPVQVRTTCPYRGLLPYDAADADSFFGREDDVAACLRRLRDTGVLAVVGPSGVGKSSLVRAGVAASLVRNGPPVLVTAPGPRPLDALAGLKPRGRQTLVVDQAEEAVTLCADAAERSAYFAALALHVGSGGRLVLALRADHLGDLAPYPEIARVLEDGLYLLGPMSEAGLRSAIEGPAHRAGLRLEPGLVDLLVREVEGEPAALPLLSHVLRETWARREGQTLTVAGYRATGGIRQAVSQTAEALYEAMDATQRTQLRSLLLRLVLPTAGGDPVRSRVLRARLAVDPEHARLVEQLVAARLVSIDDETVQIAHEALVRVWPRLRGWLDDDLDGQRLFRHLAGAADAWDAMGRPASELYRGTRLARTQEWREREARDLTETEVAFLDASVAQARAEADAAQERAVHERRSRRRFRGALAGLGVLLVLVLLAGLVAVRAADRAERSRRAEAAAAALAEARRAGDQALAAKDTALALLLSVEAGRVDTSAQARDNLGAVLTRAAPLERVRGLGGELAVSSALSPDGTMLAVSLAPDAQQPGVHLYDAATLAPRDFPATAPSSIVRFSPDAHQLAMAVNQWVPSGPPRLDELPIRLYDVASGMPSRQQLGGWRPGDSVEYALAYSADGRRIASVVQHWDLDAKHFTGRGTATVWDLRHPAEPVFEVDVPDYALLDLSADGSRLYVVTGGKDSLRAYDVDSGDLLATAGTRIAAKQAPGGIDLSPDEATVAVTSGTRVLQYDARTLRRRSLVIRGPDVAEGALYSPDGRYLLTASADESLTAWDAATGALAHRLSAPGGVWGSSMSWSPEGRVVYGTASEVGVMRWRLPSAALVLTLGESTPAVTRSAYDGSLAGPDGHTLLRVRAGRLWFVDLRTGRRTPRSAPLPDVWNPRWSPDGRWLLSVAGDERLRIWDTTTGRQVAVRQFPRGEQLRATFSADGRRVYVVDRTGFLQTVDRATLDDVATGVRVGAATTLGARGEVVVVLRPDGSVLRVRPETGEVVGSVPAGTLSNPDDAPNDASPDGRLLATADAEGRMRLLDLETVEWIGTDARADTLADAGGWVAFAPDGHQFAALQSNRIGLWDGHTGAYEGSLPLPDRATYGSIRYLPDSSGLLIAARDGRTWAADTATDAWPDRACRIAGRNLTRAEWARFFPSRPYHRSCPG